MRLALVTHTVGFILRYFGAVMVLPLLVEWTSGQGEASGGFIIAGVSASLIGEMARRCHPGGEELTRVEGLAVVALSWLVVAIFGAIPYIWAGLGMMDALFESMSGFTTTGATVLQHFDAYSRGLFFWRGLTQWLGGMGVIALFIAILPKLAIAGRQLFFAEAPGPDEERLTPRIRHTAIALWTLYAGLTGAEVLLLVLAGLPLYDAICNSFTTLAAGGFSPHPESIGGYGNPAAEWIVIVFMFLAGSNFSLHYRALRGEPQRLLRDEEFRLYSLFVLGGAVILGMALYRFSHHLPPSYLSAETNAPLDGASPFTLVRLALFQVLTILTTTGFATDDFNLWSDQAKIVLLMLMFIGGCAGSAAGGPKVVRLLLIAKYAYRELFKAIHPHAVKPIRLGTRLVAPEIMRSIIAFLLLYLLAFIFSTTVVISLGTDLLTGITASIATLGNIGPGFNAVGPMVNYAHLHPISKFILFINMWIGRLEVMTVLVLFHPQVWRSVRRR